MRRVTGYQDFVDTAPLDLIYVADHARMKLVPAAQREAYAFTAAGAMAQNVYLFCASAGLATVIRAWFDHRALAEAMGLGPTSSCCWRRRSARHRPARPRDAAPAAAVGARRKGDAAKPREALVCGSPFAASPP